MKIETTCGAESTSPCSGSAEWVECWKCDGEGFSHHDCGEDSCCCLNPEPNVPCYICQGKGGWFTEPKREGVSHEALGFREGRTPAVRLKAFFRRLWRSDVVVWPPERWGLKITNNQ
jgi:hypothetical protein